jgi:hypothetical protein
MHKCIGSYKKSSYLRCERGIGDKFSTRIRLAYAGHWAILIVCDFAALSLLFCTLPARAQSVYV